MKLSKDEIIKKLAEAVLFSAEGTSGNVRWCRHCKVTLFSNYKEKQKHNSDCPVLLAEEVLRDCEKCIHVGAENKCNCINGNKYEEKIIDPSIMNHSHCTSCGSDKMYLGNVTGLCYSCQSEKGKICSACKGSGKNNGSIRPRYLGEVCRNCNGTGVKK